jgi:hypothetical protein
VAGGVYTNDITSNNSTSTATTQVTAAAGVDFVMTSSFNLTSYTGFGGTVGFGALGDDSGLSGDYLLADIATDSGNFRLLSIGGTDFDPVASGSIGELNTTDTYTLTLTGVYSGTDLNLTFTVDNGTTSQSIAATLSSTDLADMGDYFGFRDRTSNTSGTASALSVDYDYLTISVPEPSTFAALAGLMALGAVMVRRRRA